MTGSRLRLISCDGKLENLKRNWGKFLFLKIADFDFVNLVAILILIINLAPKNIYLIIYDC